MPGDATPKGAPPEAQIPVRRLVRTGGHKVAFSIRELVGVTSEFSVKHAPNCSSSVIRTEATKYLLVYKVTCRESYSDPKGHTVRMKFDFKRAKETGTIDDLDVRVSCSCPAFLWWGAQWNVSTGDALYGAPRPELKAPTDPERYQFVICKHIKVVANRIAPVLERMLATHRDKRDRAQQDEKLKQVELVKEQTQFEVEEKKKQLAPTKVEPVAPQPIKDEEVAVAPQGPVKQYGPTKDKKKKPSGPPMVPPPLTEDESQAPVLKQPVKPALPSNITLVDEDEGPTTIIPGEDDVISLGTKRQRIETQKKVKPLPPTLKPVQKTPPPKPTPKPPSNVKVIEDEDQSTTILPGRRSSLKRVMAALNLAAVGE